MARDSERQKTYDAEDVVDKILARGGKITAYGSTFYIQPVLRFGTIDAVAAFVGMIVPDVNVRERRGDKFAHYERDTNTIAICMKGRAWAATSATVLHEISHSLVEDGPAHGAEFRSRLVGLYGEYISPEAAFLLRCAYLESGLDC